MEREYYKNFEVTMEFEMEFFESFKCNNVKIAREKFNNFKEQALCLIKENGGTDYRIEEENENEIYIIEEEHYMRFIIKLTEI